MFKPIKMTYLVLSLFALPLALVATPAQGTDPGTNCAELHYCLPTCSPDVAEGASYDYMDSRFLALAFNQNDLITQDFLQAEFQLMIPGSAQTLTFGIFDGDGSGWPQVDTQRAWDLGDGTVDYTFTLYADPTGEGYETTKVIGTWTSIDMLNDSWKEFTVANDMDAWNTQGYYVYNLVIKRTPDSVVPGNESKTTLNAFKIRTLAPAHVYIRPLVLENDDLPPWNPVNRTAWETEDFEGTAQEGGFCFISNFATFADGKAVYPELVGAGQEAEKIGCRYDGTFSFFFEYPGGEELVVYDGDFDHCSYDHHRLDFDDLDTPYVTFPWWGHAYSEEVQMAYNIEPPDDSDPNDGPASFYRPFWPSAFYTIQAPYGEMFPNYNPSGNMEGEQFKVEAGMVTPANRLTKDFDPLCPLSEGIYSIRVIGLDMQNLNHLMLPYRALCVDACGNVCDPMPAP